jgi:hypothetical protein
MKFSFLQHDFMKNRYKARKKYRTQQTDSRSNSKSCRAGQPACCETQKQGDERPLASQP